MPSFPALFAALALCWAHVDGIPTSSSSPDPCTIELHAGMTCIELESALNNRASNSQCSRTLQAADWDAVNVSNWLDNYVNNFKPGNGDHFIMDLATPFGVMQDFTDPACDISKSACVPVNCDNLYGGSNTADSAAALMVLQSFGNLASVMRNMYADIKDAGQTFLNTDMWFQQTFDQDTRPAEDLATQILLTGIQTAVAILSALAGPISSTAARTGGTAAASVAGVGGVINALLPKAPVDTGLQNLADIQLYINSTVPSAYNAVQSIFNDFLENGKSGDTSLIELFKSGALLVTEDIPYITTSAVSTQTRQDLVLHHINAGVLNVVWRMHRVWAVSFPMTQNDYDTNTWAAGTDDFRLRWYDPDSQRGFFYQSVYVQPEIAGESAPTVQNPPGWGDVGALSFSNDQILKSSWQGYQQNGFVPTTPKVDVSTLKGDLNADFAQMSEASLSLPGIFQIVQCPLNPNDGNGVNSLAAFKDILVNAGTTKSIAGVSPFCFCLSIKDQHGNKFSDQIDVGGWAEGDDDFCKR